MRETTYREELQRSGQCLIQTRGISMEPLLHAALSSVLIEKVSRPLRKMDIVLYESDSEELILHRIWKIEKNGFLLRTDNGLTEEWIRREQVIGVAAGYYRDASERFTPCGGPKDLLYRTWLRLRLAKKKRKQSGGKKKRK